MIYFLLQVYRQSLIGMPENIAAHIPAKEIVCRSLRYTKTKQRPPLPQTAELLVLGNRYTQTHTNERFLLSDEIFNGERLLIFSSDFLLNLLFDANLVLSDGTFKMVPVIFYQLFTLNVFQNQKLLPAVYVLTKRKNAETYARVFAIIQYAAVARNRIFNPRMFLNDYETGLLQAIHDIFPNSGRRGCLFHFCQAIFKNIQQLGLVHQYNNNPLIKLLVRCCMALPFLPLVQINQVYNTFERLILNNPIVSVPLQPFMTYFRNQWIINVRPEVWCVHNHEVRTNNDLEGWHYAMTRNIPRQHADIFTFINWMQDEERLTRNMQAQIEAGHHLKRSNKIYLEVERKLTEIQNNYANRLITRSQFLRGISYNMIKLPTPTVNIERPDPNAQNPIQHQNIYNDFAWNQLDTIAGLDTPLWQPWNN